MNGQKPREIAVRVLLRRKDGDFVEHLLEKALARPRLALADRHLCQELVYGIIRWQATLDWLIARKTANRSQKPLLQILLRLGLYQVFWLDRIPHYAAVNETVELARQNGFGAQAGFINALLRGYLREADATRNLLVELKTTQPHLGFSHPKWLVARWQKRWGTEDTNHLLLWDNTPPKTFARVNTLKADAGKLLQRWREENVDYDFFRCDWLDENEIFELKSHPPLHQLPSFRQGLFYVQDPSTLMAVRALGAKPGERVLDLCAAPGGKLSYIAQLMHNQGLIVAHDPSPERLELVRENCARLGVTCVQLASLADGGPGKPAPAPRKRGQQSLAPFDRILIDAPCSNTGVMSRRVELRWRIRPEEIERLQATQRDLLQKASTTLKPGGTVVYSTCSLEPEENENLVKEFLEDQAILHLESERALLPFRDNVDGAYVATLRAGLRVGPVLTCP